MAAEFEHHETAFWRDESGANPDEEIFRALRPGMSSIPGAMLLNGSSPYRRGGLDRGSCIERGRRNHRNDSSRKRVLAGDGHVEVTIPGFVATFGVGSRVICKGPSSPLKRRFEDLWRQAASDTSAIILALAVCPNHSPVNRGQGTDSGASLAVPARRRTSGRPQAFRSLRPPIRDSPAYRVWWN
jgi:hypothetical protein